MKNLPYLLACTGFSLLALSTWPGSHLAEMHATTSDLIAFSGIQELDRSFPEGLIFPSDANEALINNGPGFIETPVTVPQFGMAVTETVQVTLVNTIDLSWTVEYYSPDPTGLAYLSDSGSLLVADSEVDQAPYTGTVNLFEVSLWGDLLGTFTTPNFLSHPEPTGVAYNPSNQHLFISDDRLRRVLELDPGADGVKLTPDDIVTSFGTLPFNCDDPEGVAFDTWLGHLFIACAKNGDPESSDRVFEVAPGSNGIFDGVDPPGDDIVTYFDLAPIWLSSPEGIAFDPLYGSLYILGRKHAVETTREGTFIRSLMFSGFPPNRAMSDLTWAPASADPNRRHLYVTDRGLNDTIDGKLYEVDVPPRPFTINLPMIIN